MREYLDKVVKADQCVQRVDDIVIAADDAENQQPLGYFPVYPESWLEANDA